MIRPLYFLQVRALNLLVTPLFQGCLHEQSFQNPES